MDPRVNFLLTSSLIISLIIPIPVQNPVAKTQKTSATPATQKEDTKLRIGTAEVTLDIVVRDKKGKPVKDLTAADFEVYEDGIRQNIESFRLIVREAASGKTNEGNARSSETIKAKPSEYSPGLIALVFDRLTPEARALARNAALAYAGEGLVPNDFTGVFAIDLQLRTLQSYTNNPQLIKKAVELATSASTSTFTSNTEQIRNLNERSQALEQQASQAQSGAAGAGGGEAVGRAMIEQAMIQMELHMLENYEALERDQQGHATINSLLALLSSMRSLPGRKSVIFFSEGLVLPPALADRFNSVINAANRANVSIYAVDSAGLRIDSPNAEATRELNALAQKRMNEVHRSQPDTSGPMMKGLERNEDILRMNPHSGLGELVDQTGGFLIRETNDLNAGLHRIDEDMRLHYMLTYIPKNPEFDGRFRQISLKLSRPNLDVQTRKGYYAVDNSINSPLLGYEAPALAALYSSPKSNSASLKLGVMNFPAPNRPGLTPILVEVPASAFTYSPDKDQKTYSSDFSIVVLIRNEAKQVIQKLSQHYPLSGPIDKIGAAKQGEILFYREAELPPGRYSVEAVAYDAPANKASIGAASINLPDTDETKLRLSSLTLLKRAERLSADEKKKDHPFHFGEVMVYPNLGEPLS
ncbi:MAG: VWA domain-containing protein, partial [Blastocatellia bacterium]|nr:VWA domain-containing protein [Blastocatellia bacterium]